MTACGTGSSTPANLLFTALESNSRISGKPPWTDPEEWLGRIHPEISTRASRAGGASRKPDPDFTSEYRIRHANGSYLWILSREWPYRRGAGTAVRIAGSHTDINEGKVSMRSPGCGTGCTSWISSNAQLDSKR